MLYGLVPHGAVPVGVVESVWDTYGILYWRKEALFDNHVISDKDNVIYAPLRHRTELPQLIRNKMGS